VDEHDVGSGARSDRLGEAVANPLLSDIDIDVERAFALFRYKRDNKTPLYEKFVQTLIVPVSGRTTAHRLPPSDRQLWRTIDDDDNDNDESYRSSDVEPSDV
jgi:hypothetical protein